jgi:hypothetical protein
MLSASGGFHPTPHHKLAITLATFSTSTNSTLGASPQNIKPSTTTTALFSVSGWTQIPGHTKTGQQMLYFI